MTNATELRIADNQNDLRIQAVLAQRSTKRDKVDIAARKAANAAAKQELLELVGNAQKRHEQAFGTLVDIRHNVAESPAMVHAALSAQWVRMGQVAPNFTNWVNGR